MNDPRLNAASREEANKECGEEEREMDRFSDDAVILEELESLFESVFEAIL